jgi:hypothetical protein
MKNGLPDLGELQKEWSTGNKARLERKWKIEQSRESQKWQQRW